MASQNKITEIIAAIKTIYPYYAKDTNVTALVKIWGTLLRDFPDEAVEVALYKCLQTCKNPPTPADIIECLKALQEASEPTDEELWNEYISALRKGERLVYYFRFNAIQSNGKTQGENARDDFNALWETLPDRLKRYIGGRGEFLRMAQNYDADELKYVKPQFMKTMPTIKARKEFEQLHLLIQSGGGIGRLEGGTE